MIVPPNNTTYYDTGNSSAVFTPIVFTVPTTTGIAPLVSQTAYLAYDKCKVERISTNLHKRSFIPYVIINQNLGGGSQITMLSPKLACISKDTTHYGDSCLVYRVNSAPNYYYKVLISVQF